MRRWGVTFVLAWITLVLPAQQAPQKPAPVPDAPSATRPTPFPPVTPGTLAPRPAPDSSSSSSAPATPTAPAAETQAPAPPMPSPAVQPATGASRATDQGREELFTLVKRVNFVVVPVTVKDASGRLVDGLLRRDFAIFEDGVPQDVQLFTSDPFPLSAAIVVDTGMPDNVLQRVQETLPALAGAFSPYDEIAIYTYGTSVEQVGDFTTSPEQIAAGIRHLAEGGIPGAMRKRREGGASTVPFAGGPLNSSPKVNGRNVDPNVAIVPIVQTPARVLNDAVLRAAKDLSRRERTRRRLLFVITDGRESRSSARYQDVLKVLLSSDVTVYGLGVGAAAIPGYKTVQRTRIPLLPTGEVLPKYASATGGAMLDAFERKSIEEAYVRATLEARNQYTLGYTTRATGATNYREIDVHVHRPNLKVTAKTGYYPLPPERPAPASEPKP